MSLTKYQRILGLTKRKDALYRAWSGMMRRCYAAHAKDYRYYGGRGIAVHQPWRDFILFRQDMMASFQPGLTLDRIDVNGPYAPENCRWVDQQAQCNNRRSNHLLTNPHTGETKTLTEWARLYGISRNTVTSRIRLGYHTFEMLIAPQHAMRNGRFKDDHFREEARRVAD